ncbi:hypothetical protein ES703_21101 [subsurface metagenome]
MKTKKPESEVKASDQITVQEAGRRGGLTTSARYRDTGFYQKIGRMGGLKFASLYRDLLAEFGRRGGRPRRPSLEDSMGEESPQKKEDAVGPRDSPPA